MPEDEARNFLEEIGITELPVRPMEICRKLGIVYREQPLKSIDGMLLVDPRNASALISVNSRIIEQTRKNFTCAHEFGHYCMDSGEQSKFTCTRENIESFKKKTPPIELRANQFAAAFLMPKFLFKPLVDKGEPDWDHIKELSGLSETSLVATALRFMDLTEQACILIVSRNCAISWFHPSTKFRAFVDMDSRSLSTATIAHSAFRGAAPPNGFEIVKADNWISGHKVNAQTEILEWSLPINSYGEVLTILLDEDGIEGWGKDDYREDLDDDECSTPWEEPKFYKSKRKP